MEFGLDNRFLRWKLAQTYYTICTSGKFTAIRLKARPFPVHARRTYTPNTDTLLRVKRSPAHLISDHFGFCYSARKDTHTIYIYKLYVLIYRLGLGKYIKKIYVFEIFGTGPRRIRIIYCIIYVCDSDAGGGVPRKCERRPCSVDRFAGDMRWAPRNHINLGGTSRTVLIHTHTHRYLYDILFVFL